MAKKIQDASVLALSILILFFVNSRSSSTIVQLASLLAPSHRILDPPLFVSLYSSWITNIVEMLVSKELRQCWSFFILNQISNYRIFTT